MEEYGVVRSHKYQQKDEKEFECSSEREQAFEVAKRRVAADVTACLNKVDGYNVVSTETDRVGMGGGRSDQISLLVEVNGHIVPAVLNIYSDAIIDSSVGRVLKQRSVDDDRNAELRKYIEATKTEDNE